MKKLCLIIIFAFCGIVAVNAQTTCPVDMVCLDHATANKLFDVANQLIAAKDLIQKYAVERASSETTLNSALKLVEDYKTKDAISDQIILKYKDVVGLYEQTIKLYSDLVDKLTAQINRKQSSWSKFVGILGKVVVLLAGVAIGGGL